MRGFSGGEKRKVSLALCFAGNPKLLILDEPTTGLDSEGQKHFQKIAKDFVKKGGSLILTSHYWQEIEYIADHIVMIDKGKTILSGKIDTIKSAVGLSRVSFNCQNPSDFITKSFDYLDGKWSAISNKTDALVVKLVKKDEQFSALNISPIALDKALNIYHEKQAKQIKEIS
jgi:ABC-2 type transport system ATP-binding protein